MIWLIYFMKTKSIIQYKQKFLETKIEIIKILDKILQIGFKVKNKKCWNKISEIFRQIK
jgi:hypothetical protein